MIAPNKEMVPEIKERGTELMERIVGEYLAGASIWALRMKYSSLVSQSEIRQMLAKVVRPHGGPSKSDPSEEEIAAERDRIKEGWPHEVASRRWVGRYLSRPETLGEAFSKTLRSMGGTG